MATTSTSALQRACQAVNGSTRLAQLLTARGRTVSKASVSRWKKERVPAEFCPDIEAITGVKCEDLRPDVNWSVLRLVPATQWNGKDRRARKAASGAGEQKAA